MKKYCDVCGKPSGMYPLCPECFKLRDEGKVIKCENCGKWHLSNQKCSCQKCEIETNDDFGSDCIICGEEANGYLFCKECYKKYCDKSILLKITNCTDIELLQVLDKHEEQLICKCADGHKVRSKSEMLIDDWLFYHGYAHAYEKALPIDSDKNHDLHPDFYLIKEDIYIEHWGYENRKDYQKAKEYKLEQYKKLGITVICTTELDISDINAALERKLKYYQKGKINE